MIDVPDQIVALVPWVIAVACFPLLLLALVLGGLYVVNRRGSRGVKLPEFGVRIVAGLPGSGKSFDLVGLAIQYARAGRPVYTNLPMQWRVLQVRLANMARARGENVDYAERLIRPLHEDHFRGFVRWQTAAHEAREQLAASGLVGRSLEEAIVARCGECPASYVIPPMAVIIIDECHHWFNMMKQQLDADGLALMSYLSMHRHHLHRVIVATQDVMMINKRFRDLAQSVTLVGNTAQIKLFGVGLSSFGINVMVLRTYDAGQLETQFPKPFETRIVPYTLPCWRSRFRFYRSFTHQGSLRRLRAASKAAVEQLRGKVEGADVAESKAVKSGPSRLALFVYGAMAAGVGYWFAPRGVERESALPAVAGTDESLPPFAGVKGYRFREALTVGGPVKTGAVHDGEWTFLVAGSGSGYWCRAGLVYLHDLESGALVHVGDMATFRDFVQGNVEGFEQLRPQRADGASAPSADEPGG